MEVRDQLLRLVRLQELVIEAQSAQATVDGSPAKVEEIEQRFRDRNAEYVAVKERFEALEQDRKARSGELELLEQQREKYKEDLTKVQNEREYAAMLKEIDSVAARISENEEAILLDMEEIESAKAELASREEHIQTERERVGGESAEVAAEAEEARRRIAQLQAERAALEAELPDILVASVRRLEAGRAGLFLAKAADGVCQSCYVRIRPQVFQEIRLAHKVHYCGSCKRLLYHEPSLRPSPQQETSDDSTRPTDAGGIEALNG